MISQQFLYFIRTLGRQRLFSFINLLGLTVSIACTLLIYLYVRHEFSYDSFHHHVERIYRINQTFIWGDNTNHQFASTGPGVAYAVKAEIPEVELITSLHTPGNFIISYTTASQEIIAFEEDNILAADTNFFEMFNFPMIMGNRASALRHPNTLVMTKATAEKYFGDDNPIGKLVRLGALNGRDHTTYEVTGVVSDPPQNSYIDFDVLLSMKSFPIDKIYWSWVWTQLETYVRLTKSANVRAVREQLQTVPRKYAEQTLQRIMNTTFEDYIRSGKKWELFLQPLTRIHLPSETVLNRISNSGNIKTIYSLIAAAFGIILLACINFMNLSTAQFTRRIREASLRKVLGLTNKELSISYFFEALVFCTMALIISLAITQALLPAFNLVTGKSFEINLFVDFNVLASLLTLVVVLAAVSSSYPAWFFSRFSPAEGIKGKIKTGGEGKSLRNGLVVFQFTVSILLMISTVIVFQQLNYVSKKDLGFDKENLLVLEHIESLPNGQTIRDQALSIPGVVSASHCSSLPPFIVGGDKFTAEGMNSSFSLNYTTADENYIPTLDIEMKFGRNFHPESVGEIEKVILNESAIKKIGWPLDGSVVGRHLKYPNFDDASFEVIGVVSDFNYWSLETSIEPMAIFHIANHKVNAGDRQFLALRIKPQDTQTWGNTLAALGSLWKKHAGDSPFEYSFVDKVFAKTFQTHEQFGKVITVLAVLALMIASLGLLGMIVYSLEQRMKEIGIRKVSGASVKSIFILISRSYTKLIFIAFVVAAPLAYWLMQQWLQDFAYRINPSIGVFLLIGGVTLFVAILITAYHSIKAARMNPVDILRDE